MINNTLVPGIGPISKDVLEKIILKYGDNYEKIVPKGQKGDEQFYTVDTKYIWRDREGVDIELLIQPNNGQERDFLSLILKYGYSEKIRNNLKEKSAF